MNKKFLILNTDSSSKNNNQRFKQLLEAFKEFNFFYVDLCRPADNLNKFKNITLLRIENMSGSIREPGHIPYLDNLFSKYKFAIVFINSFVFAYYYIINIRRVSPKTLIIVDSFTPEEIKRQMLNENNILLPTIRPFLKYREMEFLVYRQANFVFVLNEYAKSKILKQLPLIKNIYAVPTKERLSRILVKEITAALPFNKKDEKPLISIVILVHNQIHLTKLCLNSIYKSRGNIKFEILVIDNGSTDGTPRFLAKQHRNNENLRVITNKKNRGFTKGINQGLRYVRGDYIVLLNNDTIVYENWIDKLLACMQSDTRIGAVCPVLDYSINGDGISLPGHYEGLKEFCLYAQSFEKVYEGLWIEVPFISFRCVMLSKKVLNETGLLDDSFTSKGFGFQDVDYCFRLRNKKLRLVCRMDVYIFHFGGETFGKMSYLKRWEREGLKRLIFKWGLKMLLYYSHLRGDWGYRLVRKE